MGPLRFVATSHVFVNDWESAAGVANTFLNRQIHTRGLSEEGGLATVRRK